MKSVRGQGLGGRWPVGHRLAWSFWGIRAKMHSAPSSHSEHFRQFRKRCPLSRHLTATYLKSVPKTAVHNLHNCEWPASPKEVPSNSLHFIPLLPLLFLPPSLRARDQGAISHQGRREGGTKTREEEGECGRQWRGRVGHISALRNRNQKSWQESKPKAGLQQHAKVAKPS